MKAAAYYSNSYIIYNQLVIKSYYLAIANYLFTPYLSIYLLIALVSLYRLECNHLSIEYTFPIVTN